MSKPYSVLEALPPEQYLDPTFFVTSYDKLGGKMEGGETREQYNRRQYEYGVKTGKEAESVFITARGTWGAHLLNGGTLTASEGIGYHAGTADLLRGFIDSGVKIVVHRYGKEPTTIQGG